ncbi:hypothetical protein DVH05_024043 [Phytophthora capsici]|nr:hypothetical protein DVH05_024043 [Phytophthora capsici]
MASSLDDFPVLTSVRVVCRECLSFRELKHINVLTNGFLPVGFIKNACNRGSLRLMKLVAARDTKSHWGDVAIIAAQQGHLDILQWLSEFHADRCDWDDVLEYAAAFGHLPVVKWLHTNRQDKCTTKAMDKAARGHLDVVVQQPIRGMYHGGNGLGSSAWLFRCGCTTTDQRDVPRRQWIGQLCLVISMWSSGCTTTEQKDVQREQ